MLAVFNCFTASCKEAGAAPLIFGTGVDADFPLGGPSLDGVRISLQTDLGRTKLMVESGSPEIFLNGTRCNHDYLPDHKYKEHTLQIGHNYFFLIKQGTKDQLLNWKDQVSKAQWVLSQWRTEAQYDRYVRSGETVAAELQPETFGPTNFTAVLAQLTTRQWVGGKVLVHMTGSDVAFFGEQVQGFNKPQLGPNAEGDLRCPRCWQRFDAGDMLAVHPSDYGDAVLGEAELRRFVPSRIGVDGRALDESGHPCSDWACPHCRGKLPQGFHQVPLHILSLVGDSMAGKSYFLTVAIRQLKRSLYRDFGLNFSDADAPENAVLNDMIRTLFTARSPSEAALNKTQMAGVTYQKSMRYGRPEMLPQPFAYNILREGHGAVTAVLYDNAGEHFRPDVDEKVKALATEHLAWSSAILFLFDPVQHVDMLRAIGQSPDPQIEKVRALRLRCDQDVILSEIAGRVRQWKGLGPGEKSDVPLAIVIGKYDLWEALMPRAELRSDLCVNGQLNDQAVLHNSKKIRGLMMEYCPEIVAAAEMISSQVRYFPVSAFGANAVKTNGGTVDIGPDPSTLQPYLVEAPLLWQFSVIEPMLLPTDSGKP